MREKAMRRNQKYLVVGAGVVVLLEVVEWWTGVEGGPENPREKIVGVARRRLGWT